MTRNLYIISALALALTACGQSPAPADAPVEVSPAPVAAPVEPTMAPPATPAPATASKPAVVADCATTIEANDAMQYNVDAIAVPASCTQFTINLKHAGALAANVMGHNLVVAKEADMAAIVSDGAGSAPEFVKAGDARIVAHTKMIGGGESSSVTFDVAKIKDGGPFKFFCSFPGHVSLMKGSIQIQ